MSLRELITSENYFDLTIDVPLGYLGAMLELLQFMYLKNTGLLTNREKILELCAVLKMKPEFVIASNVPSQLNVIDLDSCQLSNEFVNLISIKKCVDPIKENPIKKDESKQQFNITVSSNGMDTNVNVQVTHNEEKISSILFDSQKSKREPSTNHKKISLRSNAKRLRSTRNY
jgi:hypothetical protein